MKGSGRLWLAGLLLGTAAALLLLPLQGSALVQGIELKTLDSRMRLRGTAPAAPEVAVVAIDPESVDALGQWPWPRAVVAELIGRIRDAGARVIALDVLFSEPERGGGSGDAALAKAIAGGAEGAGEVVLGYYFRSSVQSPEKPAAVTDQRPRVATGDPANIATSRIELAITPPGGFPAVPAYPGVETNIDALAEATPHAGHFVVRPDVDGTVRWYSLILRHGDGFYPALALRAVSVFLDRPVSLRPSRGNLPVVRLGELTVPASESGELLVNFRGPHRETFPYIPAVDVLDGGAPAGGLDGRLVFIGATETGIADLRTTPFDLAAPGVEVHATVADNLIHARFVRSSAAERLAGMAAMLLLGPLAGLLAGLLRRPVTAGLAVGLALAATVGLAQGLFAWGNLHLPLVLPVAAGLAGYTLTTVYRTVFVEAKARQIRQTFQQFVSSAIVEEMLRDPDRVRLGGERRELTVLFSDIRGFTTLSESLPPEEVVALLNEYLTPMTGVILDCGGTLDKYIGDAIMALFGAPVPQADHAVRAATAALGMRVTLAGLNRSWRQAGRPAIANGFGINTGMMSVGNMGSEMVFDYTVIGDAVNLGSRLEGLSKLYGANIILSEFTASALPAEFLTRELDRVRVKGKTAPVTVLELVGRRQADLAAWWGTATDPADRSAAAPDGALPEFLAAWEGALGAIRARDFAAAAAGFERCLSIRPADTPSRLYLDRARALMASPPSPDWDGIFIIESK